MKHKIAYAIVEITEALFLGDSAQPIIIDASVRLWPNFHS